MKQKAWITFIELDGTLFYGWKSDGVPRELITNLIDNPIQVSGDTHLAKFYRSRADREDGTLHNTMPGSTFAKYAFEKHTFGVGVNAVTVIVGWYE